MYSYAVLGAGRQGTAAAYDMARWGQARRVILADIDLDAVSRSAERLEKLTRKGIFEPIFLDVREIEQAGAALQGVDSILSAVPYYYNLPITRCAVRIKANLCDLGGNLEIARQQHAFDADAREVGISIIPNCGQVPGMGTSLMVYAMELLDEAVDVYMWDGGIPQNPRPPFNYLLTFNIAGLTNEYAEPAVFLRDGRIQEMEPLSEPEWLDFPEPIGRLEAFIAGGGTDTMPWTYQGKLRTLQNKTLRWPGHYNQLRAYYDLGLWDTTPVRVGDVEVVPREVFHALFEPKVTFADDKDWVIVRVRAVGKKGGKDAEVIVQVIDAYDQTTGFTAMERSTGWSAAIVAEMMAQELTPRGAGGVERMVPARQFIEALRLRGIQVTEEIRLLT